MQLNQAIELIGNKNLHQRSYAQTWADLGCGDGLFTHALESLLPAGSHIYAIDKEQPAVRSSGTTVYIENRQLDFIVDGILLPPLDGILMANSLHYVKDKKQFLKKLAGILKNEHALIVVEYDTDQPVAKWVPYPISFNSLVELFQEAGYSSIIKTGERPSVYGRANMYAAWIAP